MNNKIIKPLNEKYELIREQVATAGEWSSSDGVSEKEEPVFAMTWQQAGLFEPESSEDIKKTEEAVKELRNLLTTFENNLEQWHHKHVKLGSSDTVSREQVAQFIAKDILNLVKLD